MPQMVALWRREAAEGRQDTAPSEARVRAMLAHFDGANRSCVIDEGNALTGAVVAIARPSPDGVIAHLYAAGCGSAFYEVVEWGLGFSRATGASVVQMYVARGQGPGLEAIGLRPVRPWWRMDRSLTDGLPEAIAVPGYLLADAAGTQPGTWSEMFNRTFADHWRFVPRAQAEIVGARPAGLCLMAVTEAGGAPAAITLGELETLECDPRPQPVGLISSVGTLPDHRRRGLAAWLVADSMHRLRTAGARSASLYVDGLNPQRAFDLYTKLGFVLAFEAEVWEATFP